MNFERTDGGVQVKDRKRKPKVKIDDCANIIIYWKPNDGKEY